MAQILTTITICICHLLWTADAFSIHGNDLALKSQLLESSSTAREEAETAFPPLSRDEVKSLLDNVPVYAVTDPARQDGLVLLKQKDDPKEQANFFFFPENANAKYKPFRENNPAAVWDITQYPLGLVWFELCTQESQEIDYRLVPNKFEIASAKNLVQKQQSAELQNLFHGSYNEIPIFWNSQLRVPSSKGKNGQKQSFPLYLGYQDILDAVRNASGSAYQPAISVTDLNTLIAQMMNLESTTDFRNAVFIPPSHPLESGISTAPQDLWTD